MPKPFRIANIDRSNYNQQEEKEEFFYECNVREGGSIEYNRVQSSSSEIIRKRMQARDLALGAILNLLNLTEDEATRERLLRQLLTILRYSHLLKPEAETQPEKLHGLFRSKVEGVEQWITRENRKEPVTDFIKRVYAPWLGQGLTQADILHQDRSLYNALQKWLAKPGNSLEAAGLDLPNRKQRVAAELQALGVSDADSSVRASTVPDLKERRRLDQAARRRFG